MKQTITSTYSAPTLAEAKIKARAHGHRVATCAEYAGGQWHITCAGPGRSPYLVLLEQRAEKIAAAAGRVRRYLAADLHRAAGRQS